MADGFTATFTGTDGTVYTINGDITGVSVQPPTPPTITAVQVSASATTVQPGAQVQCTATVTGTGAYSQNVSWSATAGSVDASGKFTAPATAGPATVWATSTEDATKQGSTTITVQAPPPPAPGEPVIPATAKVIDMLPAAGWKQNHDLGTPGSASGAYTYPFTLNGATVARLDMNLVNGGGYIYHKQVMQDSSAYTHFCYEVDSEGDWKAENYETDMEHVDHLGNVLDMATQLASRSGTVEITENHHWTPTGVKVNAAARVPGSRHTTKIYTTDNKNGQVTYDGVNIDGTYYPLGITAGDVDSSKWSPNDLNFQHQYDGKSGVTTQSTMYLHKLNAICW